ncbi:hypothetical protein Ancab_021358 [Ancistrocladus abbreviatus]
MGIAATYDMVGFLTSETPPPEKFTQDVVTEEDKSISKTIFNEKFTEWKKGMIHNLRPYKGNNAVKVGNGEIIPITHTGDVTVLANPGLITLQNVLVVPGVSLVTGDKACGAIAHTNLQSTPQTSIMSSSTCLGPTCTRDNPSNDEHIHVEHAGSNNQEQPSTLLELVAPSE